MLQITSVWLAKLVMVVLETPPWALRGLEYIHDHSVPVYIHRDIKSDNILLNENFTAKVLYCTMPL